MVQQKILVIEDEAPIRANILKILNFKGYETVAAEDGEIGIQQAKRHLPDLIVCDVMMPQLDGYGVLYALRQDPETSAIPLVFLTAKADRADFRQGMNLGADDYLTKPFTSAELLETVSARLAKQASVTQPLVDEIKRVAENLSRVAYIDPLTDLPNRIFLRHKLLEAVTQAQRRQSQVGVLCLNLDRFSTVNTSLGNFAGDSLLQAVAGRLLALADDSMTVARLGGDEFSLVVPETDRQRLATLAQKLVATLAQPYSLEDQPPVQSPVQSPGQSEVFLPVTIGVSLYSETSTQVDQLLTQADSARRLCRKQGGNSYLFYEGAMLTVDQDLRSLQVDLNIALERSEFLLHYQPQINAITGRMVGMEALLRWQHPTRGLVSPATFIPLAEETGMIVPIGAWVLRTACTEVKALQASSLTPLRVSVNLSARQFRQPDLLEQVVQILAETQFDPHQLVLELTETSVMEDIEGAIHTLQAFKKMGIEISIDDFGTGYSSLSYLRRLPIDVLKVDRSFVSQVTDNEHDAAIATAIIAMAKSLKLKVIAEGVETEAQLSFLRQHGCHLIQGFIYSRPVPADDIQMLLVEDKRLEAVAKSF
jgi:diguanylate cyclase